MEFLGWIGVHRGSSCKGYLVAHIQGESDMVPNKKLRMTLHFLCCHLIFSIILDQFISDKTKKSVNPTVWTCSAEVAVKVSTYIEPLTHC